MVLTGGMQTVRVIGMALATRWSINPLRTITAIKAKDFWDPAKPSQCDSSKIAAPIDELDPKVLMRKAKSLRKSLGMTSSLAKSQVLSMHATSFYSFLFSGSVSGQVLIINIVLANIYVRLFPG